MKVQIREKDYKFEMYGTVGILFTACHLLGVDMLDFGERNEDGEIRPANKMHMCTLFYCILCDCNNGFTEVLDLKSFVMSLTGKTYREMEEYFWHKYVELEGIKIDNKEKTEEEEGEQEQGED